MFLAEGLGTAQATCRAVFGTWGSFPDDACAKAQRRKEAQYMPLIYSKFNSTWRVVKR